MMRCIKFVIDTKTKGLRVNPKCEGTEWVLELYSDSDWAGDKDDRRSVSSYHVYLNGVLIAWRSRLQKIVSLSSSEAEFYAFSEAVKEIPFIAQILMSMGIRIKLPVIVRIDNVGAIFMAENQTSSSRTRHMDVRWRYTSNMIEEKLIKLVFVPTADNVSDLGTKNVTKETYESHEWKFLKSKQDQDSMNKNSE